jgi:hypothetical protein
VVDVVVVTIKTRPQVIGRAERALRIEKRSLCVALPLGGLGLVGLFLAAMAAAVI